MLTDPKTNPRTLFITKTFVTPAACHLSNPTSFILLLNGEHIGETSQIEFKYNLNM